MKTLCITGISEPDLIHINNRFRLAGMAESLSIEKNSRQMNMAQWHDRFCTAPALDQDAPGPGKFGEQLAGELFFSNMETPFWGWADFRSAFLLDFWAGFDPGIVFVLTCCPLDHHLARLMETRDAASLDLEARISSWQQYHAHLLQFYHTHPDRCLLVDIHDCSAQCNALMQTCRDKWDLPLTDIPEPGSDEYPFPAPLARHIAAGFTRNHPEATSLWNEIQATVSRLAPDTTPLDDVSFSHVVQSFQTIKDRSAERRQITDLEEQIAALQKQVQDSASQLAQEKKNTVQKDTRFKELEQKHQETTEENDLILQQMHQVQEELESMLLKKQETEQQLKQREEQIAALQKQAQESAAHLAQEKKNAAQKDSALQQVKQQLEQKNTQIQEREKQNATLQKQAQDSAAQLAQEKKNAAQKNSTLKQVEQQLEQKSSQLQEHEKQIAALQKQLKDSTEKLTQQQAAAKKDGDLDQLQKKLKQKDTRFKELEQKHQETTEENDLILQQLHQVQEELESIFLKKQEAEQQLQSLRDKHKKTMQESEQRLYQLHDAQEKLGQYLVKYQEQNKQLEKAEARWERLFKRMPDYCDYGDVRIIQGDDGSSLICEVQDLEIGSQTYPELAFETFLVGGVAGFRFKQPDHITQEDLIPIAQTSEEAKKQSKLFKSLSTTEWFLLQSTAHFLKTCLRTETFDEETLPASLIQETINGIDRFSEVITKFPQILRFDEVSMEEKVLSEDCEQLEICLENLSFGDLTSSGFIFRLSCAALKTSAFGSNPRLEFPEETGTLLKNWFDCSSNPDDPRIELRFALPEAMDLEVWNQLSEADAAIIRVLTAHLPELIEKNASPSGHDDAKWLTVAHNVAQILQRRTRLQEEENVA
jgi:hypothetical protein